MHSNGKALKRIILTICSCVVLFAVGFLLYQKYQVHFLPPVKVGILHSLSGTMEASERPVMQATLFAIDEINQKGGLLGRKIKPIIYDGASDPDQFLQGAKQLILEDQVVVIFGCWTSATRKKIKPFIEKQDALLFYPVQYEGEEESENIVYLGAAPNQQIVPGTKWCNDYLGSRFFLVGSDYVFPRTANKTIKKVLSNLQAEVVGEEYIPLGSFDVAEVVQKIVRERPDVILNTINGDTNAYFFEELRRNGIYPENIPTMSFSLSEAEVKAFHLDKNSVGDFTCWNYYQSVPLKKNHEFIQKYRRVYGNEAVVDDPMVAAYSAVNLWSNAVVKVKRFKPKYVRVSIKGRVFDSPGGLVYVDINNNHLWKDVRVGQLQPDGQFKIVWDVGALIRPKAFVPFYGKREEMRQKVTR